MNKHLAYLNYLDTSNFPKKKLGVGTDFSGIEAPMTALKVLKWLNDDLNYEQLFRCEIDEHSLQSVKCNYGEKCKTYKDITVRNHSMLPKLDIYIAGFPCVSFSMLGKRQGVDDPSGRGLFFFDCVETIKQTDPTVFILENVKGLTTHNNGETFQMVIDKLNDLEKYEIHYQVLNTVDYGIRQNRERVFIIGIKKNHLKKKFQFPLPLMKHITRIDDYLENNVNIVPYSDLTEHKIDLLCDLIDNQKIDNLNNDWFANLNVSSSKRCNPMKEIVPCLLAGEGSNCVYFLTSIGRKLTPREYLRFQGFPDQFKQCVSDSKTYKQVGNSMSVNVLCFIFQEIFRAVQF